MKSLSKTLAAAAIIASQAVHGAQEYQAGVTYMNPGAPGADLSGMVSEPHKVTDLDGCALLAGRYAAQFGYATAGCDLPTPAIVRCERLGIKGGLPVVSCVSDSFPRPQAI